MSHGERYGYDIETYPNVFTFSCICIHSSERWYYEISERRNDLGELITFLGALRHTGARMVGFNNLAFDYPVIHYIIECAAGLMNQGALIICKFIMDKVNTIFTDNNRFLHTIWQPVISQIDLFKIHHFDNRSKSTSLKLLEFNMRSVNISDLPYPPGTWLTPEQIPVLAEYNMHDVNETIKFYHHSRKLIDFRDELSVKYNNDFTNHNDTKIGKDYFIMRLEEHAPGTCYYQGNDGRRKPRQTSRDYGVSLTDVIFPYVQFQHPEFNRILQWMKAQTLTAKDLEDSLVMGVETKGVFKGVHCIVNGFRYDFGTGGIHGSLTGVAVVADGDYALIDLDVASYYPNLAIVNKLFPEHLGVLFCDIYKDVYEQRKTYRKGTAENAMLKLALNGVYGDSNNIYSPFFDPKYTMSITINGQLLLCMLAEWLLSVPGLSLVQINTDGMTVRVPHGYVTMVKTIGKQWETATGLELEDVPYRAMYIRDVNNYIGVYKDGKTKTKGAYESKQPQDRNPLGWHQNMSALIVPKAAEAFLVHGTPIEQFIAAPERDVMDFMLRAKVQRNVNLTWGGLPQQRVTRFFVAHRGFPLFKESPPPKQYTPGDFKKANGVPDNVYFAWHAANGNTYNPDVHTKNQSVYGTRVDAIMKGWVVEVCNDIRTCNWTNINHAYYIAEARKLVDCIK